MALAFETVEVREGRARLLVPDVPRRPGPGARGPTPFYNPTTAVNRDVSAAALAAWPTPPRDVLDGLAATGAWGIRMALEAGARGLVFNDRLPAAADLIRANLERNRVEGEVLTSDVGEVLASRTFDFVDIDPFGPPTPYLDAVFRRARAPSGLGITATDAAPLAGTYPDVCRERYGARPLRCAQGHEIGLRILLGYADRVARLQGRVLHPLVAFSAEHFLRVIARVEMARPTDPASPVGLVVRGPDGGFEPARSGSPDTIGPLWLGPLLDAAFVRRLFPTDATSSAGVRLLARLPDEADLPPFFESTDELARRLQASPPRLDRFLDGLRAAGFRAARTHFDPRGVKTDAPHADAVRIFRSVVPPG
jgi:tRNA (guanine26-N2/guanine27-N2)-dimethyltransferase